MHDALILGAGRSPFGARHGRFAKRHPADLLGEVLTAVLARSGTDPAAVDEVLVGCATPVGAQASNLAAASVRASGHLREALPASVVSTQDTSSLVAVLRALDAVRSGRCGIVLVGGVELMSTVPAGADLSHRGFGLPLPPPQGQELLPPGPAAERWARRRDVSRARLEDLAQRSRRRARDAQVAGRLSPELLPVAGGASQPSTDTVADERLCAGEAGDQSFTEGLYSRDGLLTAATVAPMADGAAAAVVASPAAARRLGIEPLAGVVAAAAVGGDPGAGCGSSPEAARRALALAGVGSGEVVRVELAELFATGLAHWEADRPDLAEVLNPDGGSLALGHPQGATGLGLVARLVRALTAPGGAGHGLAACDASDGHGVAVLLQA
ncbi:MAG: beta-ketoacyl synthase N-terminal-like domain-containing protein [bacterium]|nr:beta-ketoacyl synthase N-terminal-like domain-containing protein [bacterium]